MTRNELAADLRTRAAATIGIGTMLGAGIFVLPAIVGGQIGSLVPLAFLLAGVIAFCNALTVSELGTAMPTAGGSYHWTNRALGPLFGSISGIGDWVGLAIASAFYTLGFGRYLGVFLSLPPLELGVLTLSGTQLGAVLAGSAFVGLNYLGRRGIGWAQTAIVATIVGILIIFILDGLTAIRPAALVAETSIRPSSLLSATALVYVSYLGYGKIATMGEELQTPERSIPIAVLGSVVVVAVLYVLLTAIAVSVLDFSALSGETPAVLAIADLAFGATGVALMAIAGLLATASSANFSVLSASRITFAMGRQRLVGSWLTKLHPRFGTPYRSLQVTGVLIVGLILFDDIVLLALTASAYHLVVYGLLNVGLVVLRRTDDSYAPSFTVPLYPLSPVAGVVGSLALLAVMPAPVLLATGAMIVASVVWYLGYGKDRTNEEGALSRHILRRSSTMPDSAVAAAERARPERAAYSVMVSLSNPRTEGDLMALACNVAAANDGMVHAVHVVQVPDQVPLDRGPEQLDRFDDQSESLLEAAEADANNYDVPVETHLIYSHRTVEEVFDAASILDVDLLVSGWGQSSWIQQSTRPDGILDELAHDLPCDILVLRGDRFDPERIVVPTSDDENSAMCAAIAADLGETIDSALTLLHVVDGESQRPGGERFLADWINTHDLEGATPLVDTRGDVEAAIAAATADHTTLLIGATERGLLSRLVRRSLVFDIVEEADCSVIIAERKQDRGVVHRLFRR